MKIVSSLVEWTNNVFGSLGPFGLFILAFMEASFFPIPPDILLVVLALASPEKALFLGIICSIGSVLGAVFGYFLGRKLGLPVLERFISKRKIKKVHKYFEKYGSWAVGIAGFTPIPYKVFTVSAGIFYISLPKFIAASAISRTARFMAEAVLVMLLGKAVITFIDKYFGILTIIASTIIVVGYFVYLQWKKRYSKR